MILASYLVVALVVGTFTIAVVFQDSRHARHHL